MFDNHFLPCYTTAMIIAVDTGATKTLVATFQPDGHIADSIKFPTPHDQGAYFEQLIATIKQLTSNAVPSVISVALPGTIRDGIGTWCFNLKWSDVDVHTPLREAFPGAITLLQNDANLAGLGETRMLDEIPRASLYVTFSTGIGAGVIMNGHIDPNFSVSEVGQAILEFDGQMQKWESFASGRAIYTTFGQYARDIEDEAIWRSVADRMSRGLLAQLPFMQPDVLIFGGSMGTYFHRYGSYLEEILRQHLDSHLQFPRLVAAKYPEEAVIHGCRYFALDSTTDTAA